jgi:ribonuclease HI
LREAGLKVNAPKSKFCAEETEYLGYILTRTGIKPQPNKVQAILAISTPKSVRDLRSFLGMVQYYRDLWARRSEMLAPLTSLVGECGHTKVTKANKTKKRAWYWDEVHQIAFDNVKATIARDVCLAYPDYSKEFEIYTDASSKQLGAVITQGNKPIAFFSRKLTETQQRYSVTEIELLAIVETLKEFKGMLWGQRLKVYTDHKNLIQDALGLTSDRVYRWRLLLEEYGPEVVHIMGSHNTVADAISRLDICPVQEEKTNWMTFTKRWCHYTTQAPPEESTTNQQHQMNMVFANRSEEDVIYPLTVKEIALAQERDLVLKKLTKMEKYSTHLVEDTEVLCKDGKMVIPKVLQRRAVSWYHHYLQHPGHTRLEETLHAAMYWKGMRNTIRSHVKNCRICQVNK